MASQGGELRGVLGAPTGLTGCSPLRTASPSIRWATGSAQVRGERGVGVPWPPGRHPPPAPVPTERIGRFLEEQRLPLSLIGASYAGVSVNDCIASAKVAIGRLLGQPC